MKLCQQHKSEANRASTPPNPGECDVCRLERVLKAAETVVKEDGKDPLGPVEEIEELRSVLEEKL